MSELCLRLNIGQTGGFTKKINTLAACGFIAKDYVWKDNKKSLKNFKIRLKDNYLRFYLKYIKPKKELIDKGIYHDLYLEDLPNWEIIMGFQFENLVLNNISWIIEQLKIPSSSILSASPYFRRSTKKEQACQIDLLIRTKHTLYVCEIKFRKKIPAEIIDEITQKIKNLKIPKHISVRPVLIYEGDLSSKVIHADFFSHLIPFSQLLSK